MLLSHIKGALQNRYQRKQLSAESPAGLCSKTSLDIVLAEGMLSAAITSKGKDDHPTSRSGAENRKSVKIYTA